MILLGGCAGSPNLGHVEFTLDVGSTADGRVELIAYGATCGDVRAKVTREGPRFIVAVHATGECSWHENGEISTQVAFARLPLDIPEGNYTIMLESQDRLAFFLWRDGLVVTSHARANLDAKLAHLKRIRLLTREAAEHAAKSSSRWKIGACSQNVAPPGRDSGLSSWPYACTLRVPRDGPADRDRDRDALLSDVRDEFDCRPPAEFPPDESGVRGGDVAQCDTDQGGHRVTMRLVFGFEDCVVFADTRSGHDVVGRD